MVLTLAHCFSRITLSLFGRKNAGIIIELKKNHAIGISIVLHSFETNVLDILFFFNSNTGMNINLRMNVQDCSLWRLDYKK